MKRSSDERTLIASVLLSSPGPIVIGLSLLSGYTSTQLADFIRRSAELAAIIISWAVYRLTLGSGSAVRARNAGLERIAGRSVGAAMCLGGTAMALVALLSDKAVKGNVIPGLVIALLGFTTNTWFWIRYRILDRRSPNAILKAQSALYRAKALVDACVSLVLAYIALFPASPAGPCLDRMGSLVVAAYLAASGILTLRGKVKKAAPQV